VLSERGSVHFATSDQGGRLLSVADLSTSALPDLIQRNNRPGKVSVPRWMILVGAVAAQVVVSLAMESTSFVGVAQAGAIVVFGMYAVMRQDLGLIICVIAYTTGCEVLWRQTRVPIFYLSATYIVIILSGFAVLFVLRRLGRDARLAVLYIALLLPAIIGTIRTAGDGSREIISFALSGPMALAAFVAFTSQVAIAPWLYRRVLWITVISATGPLSVAIAYLRRDLAVGTVSFAEQSNFAASGGFGPVQVSSVLSLGVMAAVLLIITETNKAARVLASVIAVVMSVQMLLTFSRGGSFSVAIAIAALAVVQARNRKVRNSVLGVAAIALTLSYFVVFPWLEDFTEGAFQQRFSDTESSRTDLAANDAEIFGRNILLGVGAGMTKYERLTYEVCQLRSDDCSEEASSHTEFTRMLSEHGIPGAIGIVLLCVLAWHALRRAGPGRAFAVAWVAWAVAQMFYANLRVVAVPFAFGLAFLRMSTSGEPPDDEHEHDESDHQAAPERSVRSAAPRVAEVNVWDPATARAQPGATPPGRPLRSRPGSDEYGA